MTPLTDRMFPIGSRCKLSNPPTAHEILERENQAKAWCAIGATAAILLIAVAVAILL